ncbi:MAG: uridine kinase [Streptosporangiales bacterium]|nr:uridine kinase [Streptosporangiales bacterium]
MVLHDVAERVPAAGGDDCVRLGVDGVDGAGKTVFAGELATVLRELGRHVVRVSVDDFHHPRAVRYRRGRTSPEGCWLDSFDYARLRADVLEPLGPGGSRRYRPVAHDLVTDELVESPVHLAPPGAVLVVDGLFLHRDELRDAWEMTVFLDVPFAETARRMADRDGTNPDPRHPSMRRYVEAQRLYVAACAPRRRATLVVDNTDVDAPELVEAR